jgi:hypothetical protein
MKESRSAASTFLLTVAIVGAAAVSARSQDTCLTSPNSKAPNGSHWHFRTDRVSGKKCWHLDASDQADGTGHINRPDVSPVRRPEPTTTPAAVPLEQRNSNSDLTHPSSGDAWPDPPRSPNDGVAWPEPPKPTTTDDAQADAQQQSARGMSTGTLKNQQSSSDDAANAETADQGDKELPIASPLPGIVTFGSIVFIIGVMVAGVFFVRRAIARRTRRTPTVDHFGVTEGASAGGYGDELDEHRAADTNLALRQLLELLENNVQPLRK